MTTLRRTSIRTDIYTKLGLATIGAVQPTVEKVLRNFDDPAIANTPWWIGFAASFDRYEHAPSEWSYMTTPFDLWMYVISGVQSGWSTEVEGEFDHALDAVTRALMTDPTRGGYAATTVLEEWETNEGVLFDARYIRAGRLRFHVEWERSNITET